MIVMIWSMVRIVLRFLIVYAIGLITFGAVASLTLSQNPNFSNLFNSVRTYLMASLGNFDIMQYDSLPGWQRYYGIGLHVCVLLLNMLIMVNLLIAIMSDEYSYLSKVKTGLYWASVILEMPKFTYDKHYGTLTMFPFLASWLSLLTIPFLVCVKHRKVLVHINRICFVIVYFPISAVVLVLFMAVNLALLPFAYLKTLAHKMSLLRRYKSKT